MEARTGNNLSGLARQPGLESLKSFFEAFNLVEQSGKSAR